jgi:predicted TIM-barrel fold metal-dependent hydrolase
MQRGRSWERRVEAIDVQNHIFPLSCIKLIKEKSKRILVWSSKSGITLFDKNTKEQFNAIPKPLFSDFDKRASLLKRYGIGFALLSFPAPGPDTFGDLSVELCREINNEIIALASRYPHSFSGLACLPFSNKDEALDEMRRAIKEGNLKGIITYTNIQGEYLDSQKFYPIYERAQSLGVPIYVHPTIPTVANVLGREYGLNMLIGWPFDTSVCMLRIALSGILNKFPKLEFVVSHAGGLIPMFPTRIEKLYLAHARKLSGSNHTSDSPVKMLRRMYVDLALYGNKAGVECAISFFTPGRCMLGTDYPFGPKNGIDFLTAATSFTDNLDGIPDQKVEQILRENAASLFNIEN